MAGKAKTTGKAKTAGKVKRKPAQVDEAAEAWINEQYCRAIDKIVAPENRSPRKATRKK